MQKRILPFTALQPGGARLIHFPLHEETVNGGDVADLLEAVLDTINDRIRDSGNVSDGDLLQALCMALAIRMHMVTAPDDTVRAMVAEFLEAAEDALSESVVRSEGRA